MNKCIKFRSLSLNSVLAIIFSELFQSNNVSIQITAGQIPVESPVTLISIPHGMNHSSYSINCLLSLAVLTPSLLSRSSLQRFAAAVFMMSHSPRCPLFQSSLLMKWRQQGTDMVVLSQASSARLQRIMAGNRPALKQTFLAHIKKVWELNENVTKLPRGEKIFL